MNCSACGKANSEGISFCEFCGTDLRRIAIPNMPATAPAVPVAQPQVATPSASEVAQMGKSLQKSMKLGEKFVAGGAIAAALGGMHYGGAASEPG